MRARKLYAHGEQRNYFDKRNCIGQSILASPMVSTDDSEGFVRYGTGDRPDGLACIISNTMATCKRMYVGKKDAGQKWTDILEWCLEAVTIDSRGYGIFPVGKRSVSVWVNMQARGRKDLGRPL